VTRIAIGEKEGYRHGLFLGNASVMNDENVGYLSSLERR
jgi:hypothetical protein